MEQTSKENDSPMIFDIDDFVKDLNNLSRAKNFNIIKNSDKISGYDVSNNCIRETVFRILKYPVQDFSDTWLPVIMRAIIGNAIHSFIQNTYSGFTEKEVSLKIPSIRCSTRLDALMRDNVIVEIKSCPYTDYEKIIKTRKPRNSDFYQVLFYKMLLTNYLKECKSQNRENLRSDPPKLDEYNIRFLQLIYVAHDINAADCTSLNDAVNKARQIRKMLQTKSNPFSYMCVMTTDLNSIDVSSHMKYIIDKVNSINWYVENQKIPPMSDPFVNKKSCFFCLFKDV